MTIEVEEITVLVETNEVNVVAESSVVDANLIPQPEIKVTVTPGTDLPGLSAYEIAVANGFVGTEQEWLDSLHGDSGTGASTWGGITGTLSDQTDLQTALDGKAASSHNHDVTDVNATGTPSATTYLRGDGSWATPEGGSGTTSWGSVTGTLSDQTDLQTALNDKVDDTDARLSDARTPTAHNHDIVDVTGLQGALDGKQATGDYATSTDVTNAVANKVDDTDPRLSDARTPTAHNHPSTEITDFDTAVDAKIDAVVDAAPGTLDTLNELAAALGDDPNFATTVTGQIAAKADSVHGHIIGDVTGLQTALDGKQASGDYATSTELTTGLSGKADSTHDHIVNDVTGLQTALDGKQPSGDYATNGDLTTGLAGKADSTHDHAIANVTDLQNELDIRPVNNYRYWTGTGGSGTWDARPTLPAGRHAQAFSLLDPLAPPPPDAVAGDTWDRHPDAT